MAEDHRIKQKTKLLRKNRRSLPRHMLPQECNLPSYESKNSHIFLRNSFPQQTERGWDRREGERTLSTLRLNYKVVILQVPAGIFGTCKISSHGVICEKKVGKCPEHYQG